MDSAPLKLHKLWLLQQLTVFPFPLASTEADEAAPLQVAQLAHCFTMLFDAPEQHKTRTHATGYWRRILWRETRFPPFLQFKRLSLENNFRNGRRSTKTFKSRIQRFCLSYWHKVHHSMNKWLQLIRRGWMRSFVFLNMLFSLLPSMSTTVMHVSSGTGHSWVFRLHSSLVVEELQV